MKKIYLSAAAFFVGVSCFAQWSQVNTGIANLSSGAKLIGSSNTHLFSGTLGGYKMYKSSDNGTNWSETQLPYFNGVPECGYYFSGKFFAGMSGSLDCIYYTTDNAATWNTVTGAPASSVVRGFTSLSGNIFAYTSNKGVFKSTDGGLNWSDANSGLTNLNVIRMEVINSKLIAATIGAGIFVSVDNGATWTQSNSGIAGGDLNATLVWQMGTNLYYTQQGIASYKSTDDAANWTTWTKPSFMGLGVNEVYRNGNNLYLESRHYSGGLKDSVYTSSNEGITWTNITANLNAGDLNASGITEFGGFAFIAYNLSSPNLGIYRRAIAVGIHENTKSNLIASYPNPFNEQIILANFSSEKIKQISLYDVHGKQMVVEVNSFNNTINTTALSNGLYMIEITFGDNSIIRQKLIKANR